MPSAFRSAAADVDIRSIGEHIGIESGKPAIADQVIDELLDCCDRLAELSPISRLGTSLPQLGKAVRAFSHKRWVILFRHVDDGVLILRIADGSQNYLK